MNENKLISDKNHINNEKVLTQTKCINLQSFDSYYSHSPRTSPDKNLKNVRAYYINENERVNKMLS